MNIKQFICLYFLMDVVSLDVKLKLQIDNNAIIKIIT